MPKHTDNKQEIVAQLREQLLRMQGDGQQAGLGCRMGLDPIERVFPNGIFPTACIHEFVTATAEEAAATTGFVSGLLARMTAEEGTCLWIGTSARFSPFPPALITFGIAPERIIFVEVKRERDVLWAMEEALKSTALTAAISELPGLDFAQSQRLQLAVEKSRVTGFVLRTQPLRLGNTACAARWRIRHLPSVLESDMPGVGFPRWEVELLKVRNGNPGRWTVEWSDHQFLIPQQPVKAIHWPWKNKQFG